MIDVEMGGDEVIDLLDADIAGGFDDAFGIAFAGHAGVDEDGFAGGGHDEGGGAAFDIDPVEVERVAGWAFSGVGREANREGEEDSVGTLNHRSDERWKLIWGMFARRFDGGRRRRNDGLGREINHEG